MSKKLVFIVIILNIFYLGTVYTKECKFNVYSSTLLTSQYKMNIKHLCKEEGCVSCNNYLLELYEIKSKNISYVKGKTLHTIGNDGVTPSRFLVFEFQKENCIYKILEYDDNLFEIYKGKKLIYSEKAIYYEDLINDKKCK